MGRGLAGAATNTGRLYQARAAVTVKACWPPGASALTKDDVEL